MVSRGDITTHTVAFTIDTSLSRGHGRTLVVGGRSEFRRLAIIGADSTLSWTILLVVAHAHCSRTVVALRREFLIRNNFMLMKFAGILIIRVELPVFQVVLGVVQDLSSLGAMAVWAALVAGDNRAVVEELQEPAAVAGEDDLLLRPFNGGEEFGVVGLLELLTGLDVLVSIASSAIHPISNTASATPIQR